MMHLLIIEDETLVADSLIKLIKRLEPTARLSGPLTSVADTVKWLSENPAPDLILADIQLSDGISLDIFSSTAPGCPIIFTTAYNEYAIRAFKVNSIDYLLKPIDKDDLRAALEKFHLLQAKFYNAVYLKEMKALFADFHQEKRFKERFAVHMGRSVTLIETNNIVYFIKEELIYVVDRQDKRFITDYRSLDEVEELVNPKEFYRANRQHLIHLPFIDSYRADDTGKLTLKLRAVKSDEVIVSKEKAAEFRKWFES